MSTLLYCSSTAFMVNKRSVRARVEEIIRCDDCGGLIVGPHDYGVALCHCSKPKSDGKALSKGKLARRTGRASPRYDHGDPPPPERLDEPIRSLAWDALPPPEK